ncbi:MAG: site-specific integrase [Paracoccaceae bacterium]|nr:site-specific integrase [Paracoccaceae bacterium]
MTPLRKRMIKNMAVRGLAENAVRSYLRSVSGLARFYGRSPERISAQEVQDYLLHLHEKRGLSWKSCNCAGHGIRFLYRITLGRPDPHFYVKCCTQHFT